jgi:hypothetical protein
MPIHGVFAGLKTQRRKTQLRKTHGTHDAEDDGADKYKASEYTDSRH